VIKTIRVAELFAGVGGFRLGLEQASDNYKVVWSNQWEPGTRTQIASDLYKSKFGAAGHCNRDIATVDCMEIPQHDMLVGGFPCQDYSIAKRSDRSIGLAGDKGKMWWQIHRILSGHPSTKYLILENVDALLRSPKGNKGHDFARMLLSLNDLGFSVEWRIINAADYGMPQKRRRIFIVAYRNSTQLGILNSAFPASEIQGTSAQFSLKTVLQETDSNKTKFANSGAMVGGVVQTTKVLAKYNGPEILLKDILLPESLVPAEFYLSSDSLEKWRYLKGRKVKDRVNKVTGVPYEFREGAMPFPDHLDQPARTIITCEGGASPSRTKHAVKTTNGRFRRLMPIELERLNMFPDDHTLGATNNQRAMLMGNALVVGVVETIGAELGKCIRPSSSKGSPQPRGKLPTSDLL